MDAELLDGGQSHELPSVAWVDDLTEGIPLLLKRYDMHSGLANSAALKLASINALTPDPVGGKIDKVGAGAAELGTPTGILRERAMNLLDPFLPPTDTDANYTAALAAAQQTLLKEGITQCHHMSSLDYKSVDEIRFLQKADSEGKLWVRLRAATKLAERAEAVKFHEEEKTRFKELLRTQPNPRPGLIQTSTVKCFLDGSLGSRTLATIQPLCCRQGMHHSALLMEPPESIKLQALEAASAGLQLCFHAIGDAAVRLCIDIAEEISERDKKSGEVEESLLQDRRLRIEHCQNIDPTDVRRMAAVGCIASMQPLQLPGDTVDTDALFTPERSALSAYATRTMIKEKVQIAFGSDWMVCYPSVLGTLFVAVKRTEDLRTHPSWNPHQCLTMDEALTASTYAGSYAGFYEGTPWNLGRIQVGSIADLTILRSDPTVEVSNCQSVQEFSERCAIRATIVDGTVRFSSH
jgi:predicted amidohydrolase YtcJ